MSKITYFKPRFALTKSDMQKYEQPSMLPVAEYSIGRKESKYDYIG